jgi:hypothetical protein
MIFKEAERLGRFETGIFASLNAEKEKLIKQGKKIYNLFIGTPDFTPPAHVISALTEAAADPEVAWPPAPAPAPSDEASLWAPQPTSSSPGASSPHAAGGQGSYFTAFDDDDFWDSRPPRSDDPGRGLAIASVVFGVFAAPLGLVFGLVSARRSRQAGHAPTLALVGMVISGVVIVATLVWGISALDYVTRLSSTCAQLGPGDYVDADGRTVTCG